jgi:hypothetical protein
MSLNIGLIEKLLIPLYAGFLCLDFLDVYSTLLALKTTTMDFHELNPIASTLFSMRFDGFLIAMVFKYLPAIPLFYLVFVKDHDNKHPFEIRLIRFVALVALVAIDVYLGYVVAWNNIPTLMAFLGH